MNVNRKRVATEEVKFERNCSRALIDVQHNQGEAQTFQKAMPSFGGKLRAQPWGRAYCVKGGPEKENSAMKYLERRECEYDLKAYVDFYTEEGDSTTPFLTAVIVFTSTPNKNINKYYLGPASLEEMAREILKAVGPCGNNCDYLFKLEETMLSIGHADDEVNKLANEVRRILGVGHKVFHRSAL